jgi:hypothetical protein
VTTNGRGVLYIATGHEHVEEALLSAATVKRVSDYPVTLVSDRDVDSDHVDTTLELVDPRGGTGDQMDGMWQTPYEETLYLDTDIYVAGDPTPALELLDRFDLAAAHAPHRKPDDDSALDPPPETFPEYNSGVVAYRRNGTVRSFLDRWGDEYETDLANGLERNQPSFRRALYDSGLRLATLPTEYNCRFGFPNQVSLPVRIFHGRLQSVENRGGGQTHVLDVEKVIEAVNEQSGPRVFYPSGDSVRVTHHSDALSYRIRYSIARNGLLGTLKRAWQRV